MAVTYLPLDGERVSRRHYTWMTACRADGVTFRVNEGHRTFERQQFFWDLYQAGRGNLAAYPSHTAPHIKTGSPNHDNDIDQFYGDGIQAVFRWLRKHGAAPVLNVPGEGWHMHLSDADLAMLYRKFKSRNRVLHRGSKGEDVQRLQVLLRGVGRWDRAAGKTFGVRCEDALKGYQHSQGIKADGIYGPATRKRLEADYDRAKKRER